MGPGSGLYGCELLGQQVRCTWPDEALELEWREHGNRVGELMPPFVDTPMLRSQAQRPPVMRRLDMRLQAEQIAESAWKQAHASIVHRPVGLQFNLGQVTPGWINRLLMGWFSRP